MSHDFLFARTELDPSSKRVRPAAHLLIQQVLQRHCRVRAWPYGARVHQPVDLPKLVASLLALRRLESQPPIPGHHAALRAREARTRQCSPKQPAAAEDKLLHRLTAA